MDQVPLYFCDYRCIDLIGGGGQAQVFRGESGTGESVAIKVLAFKPGRTDDIQRSFETDVRALQRLKHPYIIQLKDFGVTQDHTTAYAYIVMQYVVRGSLADAASRGQWPPFDEALEYVQQVARALSYVHESHIIHRDVKPGNILPGEKGILLSDFGIAIIGDRTLPSERIDIHTPHYAAPEQLARGFKFAGPKSDQYALAATACWLLTSGQFSTRGDPEQERQRELAALHAYPGIALVLARALERDPRLRYPTMVYFQQALERAALTGRAYNPPPENPRDPEPRPEEVPEKPGDPSAPRNQPEPEPVPQPKPPTLPRRSSTGRQRPGRRLLAAMCLLVFLLAGYLLEVFTVWAPLAFLVPASQTIQIDYELPHGSDTVGMNAQAIEHGILYAKAHATSSIPQGYRLQFQLLDDTGPDGSASPDVGVQEVTQAIANAQVAALIGPPDSGVALKEIPVTNQAQIVQISPSNTYSCLTKNSDCPDGLEPVGETTYFRLPASDAIQGVKEAKYLTRTLHYRNVYVLYHSENVFSSGFAKSFRQEWRRDGGIVTPSSILSSALSNQV
ncbi:MAG TPA: bifunctional serine/threonine-protein kinase/ABC transporter substrate-binding protein [Ktedonobacteraceae bacterium]|jgi:serine/threonine protein kinase